MSLAHVGLGVLILGITVQGAGQIERILVLHPGETTGLAGYDVRFDGVGEAQGPNYRAQRATFTVTRGGMPVTVLNSERRYFPVEQMPTTEAGIDTNLWRDLYFVLGDPVDGGGFAVRLYYNPLVLWIWGGAGIMALAGLISLTDRRLRVGAPRPARPTPSAVAARA
jgi:cytochrome c-type biogenesis protein CcmF